MDFVLLNRIGIVLNFLAGFMLAPELLGVERLQKAEQRLKSTLMRIGKFTSTTKSRYFETFYMYRSGYTFFSAGASVLLIYLVFVRNYGIAATLYLMWLLYLIVGPPKVVKALYIGDKFDVYAGVFVPIIPIIHVVVIIYFVIIISALWLISQFAFYLDLAISRLHAEASLRSLLFVLGIGCIVVGTAMQFAATFDMPPPVVPSIPIGTPSQAP